MKPTQKFFFFLLAVCVMACMAASAILIAKANFTLSGLFLLFGILLAGIGFMTRKRILKQLEHGQPEV
jgi:hypothetical protein